MKYHESNDDPLCSSSKNDVGSTNDDPCSVYEKMYRPRYMTLDRKCLKYYRSQQALKDGEMCLGVLQCVAVCCSVLQRFAVCYMTVDCKCLKYRVVPGIRNWQLETADWIWPVSSSVL